ncbi:MAG TPA: ankyrin repeat domain-containing protein [Bacteroidales bacterium]|nr:ankyrin repeat domain-containing protein [Bacteroidales bacterium]
MHCISKSKHILIALLAIILISVPQKADGQDKIISLDTTYYLPMPWDRNSILLVAASKGYPTEIHRLVGMGADINTKSYDNATPLIYAIANNKPETVKAIMAYSPETEIFTNSSETALHIAVKLGLLEIAELLIRNEADIDISDKFGATPLHYASIYGDFYMVDLLLYYGADTDLKTVEGTTALMAAVWNGFADLSDLLLQNGSDVNAADNEGFTPLIIAAQNNDTLIADLLLSKGADINAANKYHYTALTIAIRNGDPETIEFFLKKGKDVYTNDKNSVNPYDAVRQYGRVKVLDLLENWGYERSERFSIDQVSVSAYYKGLSHDSYFGSSVSFIEPLYDLYLSLGFDFKPAYSRVLFEQNESLYYQYLDQRYIIHGGIGKQIKLRENYIRGDICLLFTLKTGYMFGKVYKGTYLKPDDRIVIMPEALLKWSKNRFDIWGGYEYMNTGLFKNGPHWLKIGASYKFFFIEHQSPLKVINWY